MSPCLESGRPVIVTGASGMLGRAFVESLAEARPDLPVLALSRAALDITDRDAVLSLADRAPGWIVHCAADVDADRCEAQPDEARRIQVGGTANVCDLAARTGAGVLYPQSFLIFDGNTLPIDEETAPNPLSVYGRCKLDAETLLRERLGESALVVRMAGFFGGEEKDKNFVGKFLRHVRALLDLDKHSFAVGDRVWQPTWTIDLARNCLVLMERGAGGLYTMSCRGEASFYDLARACIAEVGLADSVTIEPTTEARIAADQRATRPARAVMDNRRLRAEGLDRMRPWRAALAEYLARPYFHDMFKDFRRWTLFDPFDAGPLGRLKNRIAMAPMTRGFAPDHHANAAMTAYYAKRAEDGVGLIFTEGTVIHHSGDGYRNVPHIETDSQAAAWKPVVDAVHAADTRIICQLWHCGRISHPDFTGGLAPVSSTSRAAERPEPAERQALRRAARARARRDAGHLRAIRRCRRSRDCRRVRRGRAARRQRLSDR